MGKTYRKDVKRFPESLYVVAAEGDGETDLFLASETFEEAVSDAKDQGKEVIAVYERREVGTFWTQSGFDTIKESV